MRTQMEMMLENMRAMNINSPQELDSLYNEAKRWAESLRNLVLLLDVLTTLAACPKESETDEDGRKNEYFCPRVKERQVKRYVEELLSMRTNGQYVLHYKYQWFALYNQLVQRGWIAGSQNLRRFCRQMQQWFPDARVPFDYKGVVKGAEDTRRHAYRLTESRISEEFDHRERYLRNRF